MGYIHPSLLDSRRYNAIRSAEARELYHLLHHTEIRDDYGRLPADPDELRRGCYPERRHELTNDQVRAWRDELVAVGLVLLYDGPDGRQWLELTLFDRFQSKFWKTRRRRPGIRYASKDYEDGNYPDPPGYPALHWSGRISHHSRGEGRDPGPADYGLCTPPAPPAQPAAAPPAPPPAPPAPVQEPIDPSQDPGYEERVRAWVARLAAKHEAYAVAIISEKDRQVMEAAVRDAMDADVPLEALEAAMTQAQASYEGSRSEPRIKYASYYQAHGWGQLLRDVRVVKASGPGNQARAGAGPPPAARRDAQPEADAIDARVEWIRAKEAAGAVPP